MRPWLGQHRQSCALLATSLPLKFLNQQPTLPLPLPLPHLLPHSQFYLSNHSIPFSQCSTSDTSGPWQQAPATQLPPSRLNSPLPPLGLALNAESQSGTVLLPENQQRRGMRRGFNTSRALGREPWPPCLLCAMVSWCMGAADVLRKAPAVRRAALAQQVLRQSMAGPLGGGGERGRGSSLYAFMIAGLLCRFKSL